MKVTAEDIAQLLASSPPRQVPQNVLQAARSQRSGWSTALFGLFFGLFSVPFMWFFFPWRIVDEWRLAGGQTTTGMVVAVKDANMRVNGQRVMEYSFTFVDGEGTSRTGICYAGDSGRSQEGSVAVRYLPGSPEIAKIEGARLDKAGAFGSFVIIFPIVGFGMVGWFVFQRIQAGHLLRHGQVAEVDIVSVEATNMQVNKQTVYAIAMSAPHLSAGGRQTVRRVNPRDVDLAEQRVSDKQPVFVLYDPRKPTRIVFPEALIDQ